MDVKTYTAVAAKRGNQTAVRYILPSDVPCGSYIAKLKPNGFWLVPAGEGFDPAARKVTKKNEFYTCINLYIGLPGQKYSVTVGRDVIKVAFV